MGINRVIFNEDNTQILGVRSLDGEEVQLLSPTLVRADEVEVWLTELDHGMRETLRYVLIDLKKTDFI